jgi:hypothetical protein
MRRFVWQIIWEEPRFLLHAEQKPETRGWHMLTYLGISVYISVSEVTRPEFGSHVGRRIRSGSRGSVQSQLANIF